MPRTYVDNAYNRQVGRVGLPMGSAVISSTSSRGPSSTFSGGSSSFGGSSTYMAYGVSSSSSTYVDNAYNRRAGRVGLPLGSAVISSSREGAGRASSGGSCSFDGNSLCSENSSTRTYVDNAYNRRVGRAGLPLGSAVISRSDSSTPVSVAPSGSVSPVKTYVDNNFNRKAGRVGLPVGSAVLSASSGKSTSGGSKNTEYARTTYVDNSHNRSLGRVGLPLGSAVESSANRRASAYTRSLSDSVQSNKVYVDNAMNRLLGRVGKPQGSMVVRSNSHRPNIMGANPSDVERYFGFRPTLQRTRPPHSDESTNLLRDVFQHLLQSPEKDLDEKYRDVPDEQLSSVLEAVMQQFARVMEVKKWKDESKLEKDPKTDQKLIEKYIGNKIKFEDIEMGEKIGGGAFGDVHHAKYEDSIIAVKKLRVQRVSSKRLKSFVDEIQILCSLKHANIVKFIGACVVTPNLCICMEYMKQSLYEALHMIGMDLSETQKVKLISDVSSGLEYLHSHKVTHCDIKSQNVLLDYDTDSMNATLTAKLSDFGLAVMKSNSESVSSVSELPGFRGTPRYSAPEVLRGEMMNLTTWRSADVYSLSLVIYEIICNEEPFEGWNFAQLRQQVGSQGAVPKVDKSLHVREAVQRLLKLCWSRNVNERPTAVRMKTFFEEEKKIF